MLESSEVVFNDVDLQGLYTLAEYHAWARNECSMWLNICALLCYTIDGRRVACEGKHRILQHRGDRAFLLWGLGRHRKPVSVRVRLQYEWSDRGLGNGADTGCEALFSPEWP